MDAHRTIHRYYNCYRDRDKEGLRQILTPDVLHVSPFGQFDNRDQMLDTIWPEVGKTYAVDLEIYGEGDTYMVRYRHAGQGSRRFAEYIRFKADKIAEIEVYLGVGAVPFPSQE